MIKKDYIILREAYKYFRKKRYNEAILILEKIISIETQSPYSYFLLCVSYLLSNRFSDADLIMKRLRRTAPEFLPFVQLEAFLFLKAAPNSQSALLKYIEELEKFPNEKYLTTSLKVLQRVTDFESFQKSARLILHQSGLRS